MVMPVWNGERYLREAIDSILAQTFRDFEFLILDDGSTDSTPLILAAYSKRDPRIRVIPLEHEGIVAALNRGVKEARGEWIARMDCDDIAHPERFARQVKALRKSGAALCHTHIRIIGDPRWVTPAGRFIRSSALLKLRFCFQCAIVHPTVMFRKDRFQEIGGYLPEERHAEDFGLWGKFLTKERVVGIAKPLLDFRVHGESISKLKAQTQRSLAKTIAIRHCRRFLNLEEDIASRAYETLLQNAHYEASLRDWFWFLSRCAPKLQEQSVEMWLWLASRTVKNVLRKRHQL